MHRQGLQLLLHSCTEKAHRLHKYRQYYTLFIRFSYTNTNSALHISTAVQYYTLHSIRLPVCPTLFCSMPLILQQRDQLLISFRVLHSASLCTEFCVACFMNSFPLLPDYNILFHKFLTFMTSNRCVKCACTKPTTCADADICWWQ